jgi:hypothetical protein
MCGRCTTVMRGGRQHKFLYLFRCYCTFMVSSHSVMVWRDDGNRGLPFNEDPMTADGVGAASKLANMTNAAKSVPGSRLR